MGAIKFIGNYQEEISDKTLMLNKLPIEVVKDFLSLFELELDDLSKLVLFSKSLSLDKAYRVTNRKQFESLTHKELEILKLVVKGKTTSQIAKNLFIEPVTVSTHRKNIKQKLNFENIFDWYKCAKAFEIL